MHICYLNHFSLEIVGEFRFENCLEHLEIVHFAKRPTKAHKYQFNIFPHIKKRSLDIHKNLSFSFCVRCTPQLAYIHFHSYVFVQLLLSFPNAPGLCSCKILHTLLILKCLKKQHIISDHISVFRVSK